jgi:hypothetical protein
MKTLCYYIDEDIATVFESEKVMEKLLEIPGVAMPTYDVVSFEFHIDCTIEAAARVEALLAKFV